MRRRLAAMAGLLAAALVASGCGQGEAGAGTDGRLRVVAAESVWGSIAAQLGGRHVAVTDIVDNPAADPHDYEPTARDARALAVAQLAIVNGAGYDGWADRLLEADPADGRRVLDVGQLVGVPDGGNPHRWYAPGDVRRVIDAITAAYVRLDPGSRADYDALRERYLLRSLAGYRSRLRELRARYAGASVGASESIVAPLAQALGLRLVTPAAFLNAVSEGTDPTPADKAAVDRQIEQRRIAVWVYDEQNATPDVQRLTAAARARGIPVVIVSETPLPAGASFQAWQTRQLAALARALARSER